MALLLHLYNPGDPVQAKTDIDQLTEAQLNQLANDAQNFFMTAPDTTTKAELTAKIQQIYNQIRPGPST